MPESSSSSAVDCGDTISIRLTPQFQSNYVVGEHVGFRLRVDASDPCNMSDAIFRYFQKPMTGGGVVESVFSGVCSWPDLEELPLDEPEPDTSPAGFRLTYFDIVVDSETLANEIWSLIITQVTELVQTIKDGQDLAADTPVDIVAT